MSQHPQDKILLEKEAKYCSWGDTVHYAKEIKIFNRCEGSFVFDRNNTSYLDLQMWHSVANFGYKNERLNNIVKGQIDVLPQLSCQYLHEEKILLSEKIALNVEKTFGVKGRVHFNIGGAAAIEDAIKIVRNHTKKQSMFAFTGGYHGRTLGATSITSSYRYRENYGHFSDRAYFVPYPYRFRCPSGKSDAECCDLTCFKDFSKLFESEYYSIVNPKTKNCEYGGFFVEPVQATGGYIVPPKGYFKELKKLLERHQVLFVSDEVHMGFYRTGKMWAIEHFDVVPDIIVFGKACTNGLNPLSGVWAKEELINPDVFPAGSTHSTYSSNTIGTAAALGVMDLIEDSDFATSVPEKGRYFVERLKTLQKKYPQIGEVDGLGLAMRIEICQKDGRTPDRELTDRVVNIGLEGQLTAGGGKPKGLLLGVGGYYKNVFTLAPSLYITRQEIDLAVDLIDEALRQGLSLK
ncbi:MAG: aminotransferase class III-fold pyridoxal phosphate-dependent enzyme [Candidatus Omnitrophica bacterium]|nr:aminotransferase class III-fold pyridoxal phosphate-dependent enzyme [Candidatus Omnitrophota bacterium]